MSLNVLSHTSDFSLNALFFVTLLPLDEEKKIDFNLFQCKTVKYMEDSIA